MSKTLIALIAALCLPVFAHAGTSTDFPQVMNDNFDAAADGFNTFAMRVTADTDWTNSDLSINLDSGTLNHIEAATPIGGTGPVAGVAGFGDTAVFGPTTDLGNAVAAIGNSPQLATDYSESATAFTANWFNTATDDIGTFDIGMISLSQDANGEIRFRTISGSEVEEGGFTVVNGVQAAPTWLIRNGAVVPVPEPGTIALAGLALVGLCASSRRR